MTQFQRIVAACLVLVSLAGSYALWSVGTRARRVVMSHENELMYLDTWKNEWCVVRQVAFCLPRQ